MWKKNRGMILVTTLTILLPVLVGLILWNDLPEQMPTHWGISGEPDAFASKAEAVFWLPCFLVGLHLLCLGVSFTDPKHHVYEGKMLNLVLWICPVISLVVNSLMYATALGWGVDVPMVMCLLVGLGFVVMGNYLPKCRHNYTLGIKLPWTLADEGNWNATHRFGGWVWVSCGVLTMATAFLGSFWILLGILLLAVILPTIYSYTYYRKHREET